jgi:hypothetical protein
MAHKTEKHLRFLCRVSRISAGSQRAMHASYVASQW